MLPLKSAKVSTGWTPVAGSYLERVAQRLQSSNSCPERDVELGKAAIYMYVEHNLETDSNAE